MLLPIAYNQFIAKFNNNFRVAVLIYTWIFFPIIFTDKSYEKNILKITYMYWCLFYWIIKIYKYFTCRSYNIGETGASCHTMD